VAATEAGNPPVFWGGIAGSNDDDLEAMFAGMGLPPAVSALKNGLSERVRCSYRSAPRRSGSGR